MWILVVGFNLLIAACYTVIAALILRGLVRTHQLRVNPLALATAGIFVSCALHHGAHGVALVLMPMMRASMSVWPYVVIDGVGAVAAVVYLSLRRHYGALIGAPSMFSDVEDMAYRHLAANLPHTNVFLIDADLRYRLAAGAGSPDIGSDMQAMVGHHPSGVLAPEVWSVLEQHYRGAVKGETSELDITLPSGVFHVRAVPMRDRNGSVTGGLIVAENVTEQRDAMSRLSEALAFSDAVLTASPIGQAIVELDGTWRQVNAAVCELTGYTEEQLLSMTFQDITHPDDLLLDLDHLTRLVADEIGSYQIEKRYFTASGQTVWVLLSVALVRNQDGSPLYFISQILNITERKRQQHALQDLTAMVAHDIRTPATVARGFAELLEDSAGMEPEMIHSYAARISAAARAMTGLLDNAFTATALDSGQLVASPQDARVRDVIADAIDLVDRPTMSIDTSGVLDVTACVDPVHLTQIFANLLTNAGKYGGDHVVVLATANTDRVYISVTDNGPGVDPDFVPYLFDRFSRSDSSRGGAQRGSGLGLYIVRDLLAANGGTIQYAVCPSGGARFTVELGAGPDGPTTTLPGGR